MRSLLAASWLALAAALTAAEARELPFRSGIAPAAGTVAVVGERLSAGGLAVAAAGIEPGIIDPPQNAGGIAGSRSAGGIANPARDGWGGEGRRGAMPSGPAGGVDPARLNDLNVAREDRHDTANT